MKTLRALLPLLVACLAGCVSTSTGGSDESDWTAAGDREPDPASLHAMARLYVAQGRDEQAEASLRQLVQREPGFLPAYEELARLYVRRDLLDGAIAALELGLERSANDPVLLNDLGLCHLLQHDLQRATAAFTRAAAVSANDTRPRANLALTLALLGRDEEALALWQQLLPPDEAAANLALVAAAR